MRSASLPVGRQVRKCEVQSAKEKGGLQRTETLCESTVRYVYYVVSEPARCQTGASATSLTMNCDFQSIESIPNYGDHVVHVIFLPVNCNSPAHQTLSQ